MISSWMWMVRLRKAILFRFCNYLLIGGLGIGISFLFSGLTERLLTGNYEDMGWVLAGTAAVIAVYGFLIPALQYLEGNRMEEEGGKADMEVFREFLRQKPPAAKQDVGGCIRVLWSDFPIYRMNLIFLCAYLPAGLCAGGTALYLIARQSHGLAAAVFGACVLSVAVPYLFQQKLRQKKTELAKETDCLMQTMKSIFRNGEYIRLEKHQAVMAALLRPVQKRCAQKMTAYENQNMELMYAGRFTAVFLEMVVYGVGCRLIFRGKLDYAQFVKTVFLTAVLKEGTGWFAQAIGCIHKIKSSRERIRVWFAKSEEKSGEMIPSLDTVELSGLSFCYPGESGWLRYPDMRFKKGQIHIISGKNGAGKTTLLKLMSGELEAGEGKVLVNGTPLYLLNRGQYCRFMAYIPQQPDLFHMTVKENVLFGMEQVDEAWYQKLMEDFRLSELEEKQVSFGGGNLSGGERQSISIVRALLRRPQLVLADEPFNTLDEKRQQALCGYMDQMEDTMFLVVSHRDILLKRTVTRCTF